MGGFGGRGQENMGWNEIILGFEQEQLRYTAGCLFVLVVRASRFERERRERRGLGKDWVVLERVRGKGGWSDM